MGCILVQPDNSSELLTSFIHLAEIGDCWSRSKLSYGEEYHSFVGDIACGRWSITHSRRYLWGKNFYWICDYSSTKKELRENTGSVHQLRR